MGKTDKKEIAKHLLGNKSKIFGAIKFYKQMCMKCRLKMKRLGADMPYDKYCPECKKLAKELLGYE